MNQRISVIRLLALLLAVPLLYLSAPSASAKPDEATVTVLNAMTESAEAVDIYAETRLIARGLTPGQQRTLSVPSGTFEIAAVPRGLSPRASASVIASARVRFAPGKNITLVAHSSPRPKITTFVNDTATVGMGQGRLTVRNVADISAIDVKAGRRALANGLRAGEQTALGLFAGTYRVNVTSTFGARPLKTSKAVTITNKPGRQDMGINAIVYVWGSADDGSLRIARQDVRLDLQ